MEASHLKIYKSLLRNKLRQNVSRIGILERKRKSLRILKQLLHTQAFRNSQNILTYVSLGGEVETEAFIQKSLAAGKNIFAPRVSSKRGEMEIFRVRHPSHDLKKGFKGIPEPRKKLSAQVNPRDLDLILVPGLGFDRQGRWLGRGGGYFDRFLKQAVKAKKIGLAFREQILKKIPEAIHDVSVDQVLTD